jgi:hypothetical protein
LLSQYVMVSFLFLVALLQLMIRTFSKLYTMIKPSFFSSMSSGVVIYNLLIVLQIVSSA